MTICGILSRWFILKISADQARPLCRKSKVELDLQVVLWKKMGFCKFLDDVTGNHQITRICQQSIIKWTASNNVKCYFRFNIVPVSFNTLQDAAIEVIQIFNIYYLLI